MSIANEILRLQQAKETLKTKLNSRNDSEHQITNQTLDQYGTFVDSIAGEKTFVKDMQVGDDVSGRTFSLDTTGYTPQELTDGIQYTDTNGIFALGTQNEITVYSFEISGGIVLSRVSYDSGVSVKKTSGEVLTNIEEQHIYLWYIKQVYETVSNIVVLADLTTNENYGGFVLPDEQYILINNYSTVLTNNVVWNCIKLIDQSRKVQETFARDMQPGFNVSNAMFTVDTTGYTSQELINGLAYDSENIHYGFGGSGKIHAYAIYIVSGAFINGFVEELKPYVNVGVYKPYATEFGTVEDSHFYVGVLDIDINTELPSGVYILNDLSTNTSYGNFLLPDGYVFGGDEFTLPDSVLWNCMKIIKLL